MIHHIPYIHSIRYLKVGAIVGFLLMIVLLAGNTSDPYGHGSRHRVITVIDGDTVILEGGESVRLTGIQAPELYPVSELFAVEAKEALEELVLGREVILHSRGAIRDRYDRLLAHLERDDGLWVQGALLTAGLVRVYTFPDNRARAVQMLEREQEARLHLRGLWQHPDYAIRQLEQTYDDIDTFQIVEGTIYKATKVRSRIYLNFDHDWRTDFTIRVERQARRLFSESEIDLLELKGKHIRVRGWIRLRNGPEIQVTHPEQIEILS